MLAEEANIRVADDRGTTAGNESFLRFPERKTGKRCFVFFSTKFSISTVSLKIYQFSAITQNFWSDNSGCGMPTMGLT